jgi:hypothetical protein
VAAHEPSACAAASPEACSALAHAELPGQAASSLLHPTSSAHAVTWPQQEVPRHVSQEPSAAISVQNERGSGWQRPAPSDWFQTHGSPPAHSAAEVHVG